MGACAAASAGSGGIASPHCSPRTLGLAGKDRRWASGRLRATAAPPRGRVGTMGLDEEGAGAGAGRGPGGSWLVYREQCSP